MKKPASKNTPSVYAEHGNINEQLEWYKLLVQSVQDYAIILLNKKGNVLTWNAGAERSKGYTREEIVGKHFSNFYTEHDKKRGHPEELLTIARKEGHAEDEGWRVRKDGTKFWTNVVITALFDKQGVLQGYAKVTSDLTRRKKNEDILKKANKLLRAQQKELTLLNQSKDEFISLASHQLRTPATGVKQYLGMLLEGYAGELTEQQTDILQRAYEGNDRQIATVNDLLRVAQIDSGKMTINQKPTNINELIENVIDEQADVFKNRQQRVTYNKPSEKLIINIDAVRFRMALENLIDNASKYTPNLGTITISISSDENCFYIDISDTGVGMTKNDMAKLFTKFFRIPNKLSSAQNGSGLGLYWAKRVIELHKGVLSVTSTPGKGSVFRISGEMEKL